VNRIDPMVPFEPEPEPRPPAGKVTTAKVFAVFASAWPRREVNEPELNLWAHQIGHLPEAVALEAATTLVRISEWWPTIARFIEVAKEIQVRRSRVENVAALPEHRDLELAKAKVREIRADMKTDRGDATNKER
jgi:hypothetical protein